MPDQSVSLDDEDLAAQSAVKHLRKLKIDNDTVRRLLGEARTHNVWHQRDVSDDTLRSIVDLMQMGPTSANGSCLLYTSPSPRDGLLSRMPSSA